MKIACKFDHIVVPLNNTYVLIEAGKDLEIPDQDALKLLANYPDKLEKVAEVVSKKVIDSAEKVK